MAISAISKNFGKNVGKNIGKNIGKNTGKVGTSGNRVGGQVGMVGSSRTGRAGTVAAKPKPKPKPNQTANKVNSPNKKVLAAATAGGLGVYAVGRGDVEKEIAACVDACEPENYEAGVTKKDGITFSKIEGTEDQPICTETVFDEQNGNCANYCDEACDDIHGGLLNKFGAGIDKATGNIGVGDVLKDAGGVATDIAEEAGDLAKDLGKDLVPPLPDLGISDFMRNMVMGIIVFIIIFIIGKQFLKRGVSRIV